MILDTEATFPNSVRLRKRAEFIKLSATPHKRSVRGFLIVWDENNLKTARLGITASKKIGCAVVRNRVKRFLREFFRHNRVGMAAVDINVIARRESAAMTFADVVLELKKAFRFIGVSICSKVSFFL